MFQDIRYEDLPRHKNLALIDVRSPGEFQESSIPGAINIPLFSDEERAQVGTAYKQISPEKAQEIGLVLVSHKLPELLHEVRERSRGKTPVIYCSRGGMRSKTVATLADLIGIELFRLEGGYRAYRNWVVEQLSHYRLTARFVMLHGLTGVGKTDVIDLLIEQGEPAIDLERLAGHRGSAFGGLGLFPQNQRSFDARLLEALEPLKNSRYLIMEAESKRIGRVQLPDFLMEGREQAIHFLLVADIPTRVQRILSQYVVSSPDFVENVAGALRSIQKRISPEDREFLWEKWEARDWDAFVARLLTAYYDPLYTYSTKQYGAELIEVDATSIADCASEIKQFLQREFRQELNTAGIRLE